MNTAHEYGPCEHNSRNLKAGADPRREGTPTSTKFQPPAPLVSLACYFSILEETISRSPLDKILDSPMDGATANIPFTSSWSESMLHFVCTMPSQTKMEDTVETEGTLHTHYEFETQHIFETRRTDTQPISAPVYECACTCRLTNNCCASVCVCVCVCV